MENKSNKKKPSWKIKQRTKNSQKSYRRRLEQMAARENWWTESEKDGQLLVHQLRWRMSGGGWRMAGLRVAAVQSDFRAELWRGEKPQKSVYLTIRQNYTQVREGLGQDDVEEEEAAYSATGDGDFGGGSEEKNNFGGWI